MSISRPISRPYTHRLAGSMAAIDAEERGQLIPGLPQEVVLAHVVPRLPWYTRPLCRALSHSWRAVLDTRNPDLDLRTRMIQIPALRGLFLFYISDRHIFIRDNAIHDPWQTKAYKIQPHWRRLPPLVGDSSYLLITANVYASSGMVYVWSSFGSLNFLLKLDVGCAEWTWKKLPVPHPFECGAISFNGKIYVPVAPIRHHQEHGILVHDMTTDECKLEEIYNGMAIRVISEGRRSNLCSEEMYCFVEHELETQVGVMKYDVGSDSWRTHENVPAPPRQSSFRSHIKLLNSDCFEPAQEGGINIIWVSQIYKSFLWFNSSVGENWVKVCSNSVMNGLHLEYLESLRGSMYGFFIDRQGEEEGIGKKEDGGGRLILSKRREKRTIMKGIVKLASKSVAWEKVHEVGFFPERDPYKPAIDCFTFMA